jgi:LuxR family maltose regulon positive regulatory protein
MATERPTIPIIRTKLYRPPVTTHLVCRERLHAELERGRELPMTLVSAPAGYGKSTLVSHWLENADLPHAWLSLDETDNDLRTFLNYFVAAVSAVEPNGCQDTIGVLAAGDLPDASTLASCLSNDLDAVSMRFVLVLDDYHLISNSAIHDLLANLLTHPPRSVHLVIIARRNPAFPLSSLRARGVLKEIRVQELQFRTEETGALLERDAGCQVSRKALSHAQELTEGWVAGLRLVALSLRGRDNADAHLCEMRGDIRSIQDYLVAEVLSRQPPRFKDCLLRTAILDRFCVRLCEAVVNCQSCTPDCSPAGFIGRLEQAELFLVRLDDQAKWFRHHHLFRELLHRQLIEQVGEEGVAALHVEASGWFEGEGLVDEALHHAFEADNAALAGQIIVRRRRDFLELEQWHRLEEWLGRLPGEVLGSDPELLLIKAWLLENRHRVDEVWPMLDQAEVLLASAPPAAEATNRVKGEIHAIRSRHPYEIGDGRQTVRHAEEALRLLPRDRQAERGYALVMLATGHQMSGDLAQARQVVFDALASEEASAEHFHGRMLITLCFVCWMSGDLPELKRTATHLLRMGREQGLPEAGGFGRYFAGIAHYQHNELADVDNIVQPLVSDRAIARTNIFANSAFVVASMHEALGRQDDARAMADHIVERMLEKRHPVLLSAAEAFRADLALRQGHLSQAVHWAQQFDPGPLTAMYLAYIPAFTLAKTLLAENTEQSLSRLNALLDRLAQFVSRTHNRRFEIDVLAIKALMLEQQGDEAGARRELDRAVRLAQPSGFIRALVDLGPGIARLLNRLELDDEGLLYVDRILTAFKGDSAARTTPSSDSLDQSGLVVPLSKREIEVLCLLAKRLRNKEIAERLHISTETVRRHTSTVYSKLGVHGRRQAVDKATSLRILPPS